MLQASLLDFSLQGYQPVTKFPLKRKKVHATGIASRCLMGAAVCQGEGRVSPVYNGPTVGVGNASGTEGRRLLEACVGFKGRDEALGVNREGGLRRLGSQRV